MLSMLRPPGTEPGRRMSMLRPPGTRSGRRLMALMQAGHRLVLFWQQRLLRLSGCRRLRTQ